MKKGLSKKREQRWATAAELSAGLVQATGERASEPPPKEEPTLTEIATEVEDHTSDPVARSERAPTIAAPRRRLWPVLAVAVALATVGVLAVASSKRQGEPSAASEPAKAPPAVVPAAAPPPEPARAPAPPAASASEAPAAPPSASAIPSAAASPAAATPAKRPIRTEKPAARPGTVAKRAGELWNKKDEL
jgi:hypothetical protein